jgi:hypothetical protein
VYFRVLSGEKNTKNMKSEIIKDKLSPHLFWDIDKSNICLDKNKRWLIQRVLEYGLLNDWLIILKYYGMDEIVQTATKLKHLDKKSLSFISCYRALLEKNFYVTPQSIESKTLELLNKIMQFEVFKQLRLVGETSLALQIGHKIIS